MIAFRKLYEQLHNSYGPQHWWPADDRFEVMLGAILVQRTTWPNVEAAIALLRQQDLLVAERLAQSSLEVLEQCVRGTGFYRAKARRIQLLAGFVAESGGVSALAELPTSDLREQLLAQEGVGPETADAILLYMFDRPVVVIDTYLRRFSARLLGREVPPSDRVLNALVSEEIHETADLNEFHALVVAHGKSTCGARPQCGSCVVRVACASAA